MFKYLLFYYIVTYHIVTDFFNRLTMEMLEDFCVLYVKFLQSLNEFWYVYGNSQGLMFFSFKVSLSEKLHKTNKTIDMTKLIASTEYYRFLQMLKRELVLILCSSKAHINDKIIVLYV